VQKPRESGIQTGLSEDQPGLIGYALNPDFAAEPIAGRICCDGWRLRFESGEAAVEFPITGLEIEMGDARDGRILFSHPNCPDWSIYTFDDRILEDDVLLRQSDTRIQIQEILGRGELKRRLILTGTCLGVVILVTIAISMLTSVMVRSLVARIPPEWEQELGDEQMAELKQTEVFLEDAALKTQLDRAMKPLLAVLPTNRVAFKSYIIEDPIPNACALPGGHVLVTTGLLKLAERPEEVAGTVAHEIAHVTQKHGFRHIISSAGPFLVFRLFLGGKGLSGLIAQGSGLLVSQSFSQDYELEADGVGWDYLVAAHIDPRGLTEMLRKLQAVEKKSDVQEISTFNSHPPTEKRIRRLMSKWDKLKNKSGFVELPRQ
jgi:Zn-dependent protease with chaperone function